ncbi:hypothetical protein [Aeromicrobium chenweiae]|uniref:Uncharacterized protein n=1 Tax=Aeromicrobium chenweiae TaxID=2079793 RepID=A0A2S0WQK1_9ACTN|nr:hypothetical protein [Aeromicrobium chenweiae]AWB93597.1 hypothetical protein C3E78_16040 [Aeromicrobium chenweiae]TGN33247.1 hypothetical protein E4L97_06055 [Aeromicrobium chenweiae]
MTAEKSLVVEQGALADIGAALTSAHDEIARQVADALAKVDAETSAWSDATLSGAAHAQYQQKLRDGVERLTTALEKVRVALADVATSAHDTEVDNRAIID